MIIILGIKERHPIAKPSGAHQSECMDTAAGFSSGMMSAANCEGPGLIFQAANFLARGPEAHNKSSQDRYEG